MEQPGNRTDDLEALPFIGSLVDGIPSENGEYHVIGVHNYLVFYHVTDTGIFIDRILYKRGDYLPLLGLLE